MRRSKSCWWETSRGAPAPGYDAQAVDVLARAQVDSSRSARGKGGCVSEATVIFVQCCCYHLHMASTLVLGELVSSALYGACHHTPAA